MYLLGILCLSVYTVQQLGKNKVLFYYFDLATTPPRPGGVVASTFAFHADDRGSIPTGDRFGRMQVGHQTMV